MKEKSKLQEEFEANVKEFEGQTSDLFDEIYGMIGTIQEISEKTGVPFELEVGDVSRAYLPKKFIKINQKLSFDPDDENYVPEYDDPCVYYERKLGFYPWKALENCGEGGDWEHWNSSSLRC